MYPRTSQTKIHKWWFSLQFCTWNLISYQFITSRFFQNFNILYLIKFKGRRTKLCLSPQIYNIHLIHYVHKHIFHTDNRRLRSHTRTIGLIPTTNQTINHTDNQFPQINSILNFLARNYFVLFSSLALLQDECDLILKSRICCYIGKKLSKI